MQAPFYPLSFGKSFMKIRSAIPENGCLVFLWRTEKAKTKKNKKTSVKHIRIWLFGGCVNEWVVLTALNLTLVREKSGKLWFACGVLPQLR